MTYDSPRQVDRAPCDRVLQYAAADSAPDAGYERVSEAD
jgi:hypothetical protein